jgi:hypothetical protein
MRTKCMPAGRRLGRSPEPYQDLTVLEGQISIVTSSLNPTRLTGAAGGWAALARESRHVLPNPSLTNSQPVAWTYPISP